MSNDTPAPRRTGAGDHFYDACKPDASLPTWAFKVWRDVPSAVPGGVKAESLVTTSPQTYATVHDALAGAEAWLRDRGIAATLPL